MKWLFLIIIKIILSRVSFSYKFLRFIGIFRHGRMHKLEYATKIFNLHVKRAFPNGMPTNSVILELGPGDSMASALLGSAMNANKIYLIDAGNYCISDISFYKSLALEMKAIGIKVPDISMANTIEDFKSLLKISYCTNGIASLRLIPSKSVDFIWSHSVLEHVRLHEVKPLLFELQRILKHDGLASHNIDFQDHLDKGLNNLRFSHKLWESNFFSKSGFYTNRIPAVLLHKMFNEVGFITVKEGFGRWDFLPISRKYIHKEFQYLANEDLINRTSHVLLKNSDNYSL